MLRINKPTQYSANKGIYWLRRLLNSEINVIELDADIFVYFDHENQYFEYNANNLTLWFSLLNIFQPLDNYDISVDDMCEIIKSEIKKKCDLKIKYVRCAKFW